MHRLLAIALVTLVLSSCASVPGSPGEESSTSATFQSASNSFNRALTSLGGTISGLLSRQLGEFKGYVERNELDTAAHYYIAHEKELPATEQVSALLATLVGKLNDAYSGKSGQYGASFDDLAASLERHEVPADVVNWPIIHADLASARKRLALYDGVGLLTRPAHRAPAYGRLEEAVKSISTRLVENADAAFAAYEHVRTQPFFDVYPEELGARRDAVVKRAYAAWTAPLSKAPLAEVERLVQLYGKTVDEEPKRVALSAIVVAAMMRENGWRAPLALPHSLQVAEYLGRLSLPLPSTMQAVEMVVLASDDSETRAWTFERPGIAAKAVNAPQFDAMLQQVSTRKADRAYLFVDLTPRFAHKGMTQVGKRTSRRVIAQREEPNPEYDRAEAELREAERRAQEARQMDQQNQEQARQLGSMGGLSQLQALATLGASGVSNWASQSAQREANEARSRLQSTPRTVFKPVTESYEIGVATHEAVKGHRVTLYALEPGAPRFKRFELSDISRTTADTELGIDGRDERKAEIERRNAEALARLDRFVATPGVPEPAQLLTHVASAKPAELPLATLPRQRSQDQRTWQMLAATEERRITTQAAAAEIRAEEYTARADSGARVAVINSPEHRARRSEPRSEENDSPANPFTGNPFMPNNLKASNPAGRRAANMGGGGGGYDCKAEEQRILRVVNSAGQGDASICQSGKDMLRIANEALPFYERCPIADPKGEMRAWLRDSKVKAQGMVDKTCVEQPAPRPRSNPDLRSRAQPAPAPVRSAPPPTYSGGRSSGSGQK